MDSNGAAHQEVSGDQIAENRSGAEKAVLHAMGLPTGIDPENLQGEDPVSTASTVELKVTHNKQLMSVTIALDQTVKNLKEMLAVLTGIPADKQKLMWSKGPCPDDKTIEELGAKNGSKFMMVGSSEKEISNVQSKPDLSTLNALQQSSDKPEKLCEQTMHRKVIDKGMPSDVMPGILNEREALPPFPLSGMLNKRGSSVRLTFKLEMDQVWIGTKERTEKVQIGSIRNVISEPIVGHEEYHLLALQMGPTEASRYWLYWVPAQYVDAIKEIFSQFDLSAD
ncbi:ubiquitin domain-containing protein UBFD1-like [Paramacrobiotus metropolitanus]|uniref:ubiquitin domain-containing protein UBFD1-like n=1 Tax=Paramacrobiotus metropolitanus TaxID=2943436 RepID=UPI00244561C5|nr:ubiquitin domain-containing protein UBFD1-like [Paramacrobiotus metropolitanus]XP_055357253.1 ubiquitin domain-containing protein UBFD1-like [Paramacrobiotus metropolitanus]